MIKKVRVNQIKIGDIVGEDILWESREYPLVTRNTIVNEYIKSRLRDLNISHIDIFDPDYKEIDTNDDSYNRKLEEKKTLFKRNYRKSILNVRDIFRDIAKGESINFSKITNVSTDLFKNAKDVLATIESINEIKEIDDYTYNHSINVALYSMYLADWLRLEKREIKSIIKAGILHDIGKGKIDQEILNKPGKLTEEEFNEMQKHTIYGYDICKPIIWLSDEIKHGALMHHEKIDGSGYPFGLKGDQIPIYAKIIAICDIYDALNSKRVYKEKQTPFDTFSQMIKIGKGKLDSKILYIFLTNIVHIYIGSKVKMNTGDIGEVAFIPPTNITNPIVKINNKYYDLSKSRKYKIKEMI
ncbi:putative metal dependent phosphohydrolase [Gottschalkia acidurici 9a]|uniref:Metal dependent phosphohydrolase n=1 Tax=Gottschalkia acidurici (strain ATCC 7906 / DSM 604 / BCRC 14475 / CIP 104303 / KCTC 5404 / NCIMB 10678 / 9a) TaxID=1128398 RepID=K0B4H5_GOTA9|nr:putative metal dependent phosphohydrolase [Gottschalkia acidurici 9a]